MIRRWHLWLLLILAVAGLAALFWPTPVTEELREPPPSGSDGETTSAAPIDAEVVPEPVEPLPTANASALNDAAMNAWRTGDIPGAMDLFEQAIDRFPDDPAPHANYGRLLTLMLSYEKALPLLERARDLRPGDAQSWLDLATLYERVQRLELSWEAQAEARKLVGDAAITRDEQGRFIVEGSPIW